LTIAGLVICSWARVAQAQAQERSGFEIGGRLGYGVPFGRVTDDPDDEMDKGIKGQVPLWFDIGGRISSNFFIGAAVQYGFGLLGSDFSTSCDQSGVDCSVHVIRIGPEFIYHFLPFEKVDPWIGAGFGYEWLSLSASVPGADLSLTAHGFEFINFQGGVDFLVGSNMGIGPFLSFSLGQYDAQSLDCSGAGCAGVSQSGSIDNKALHEWLVFGARFTAVL
jgi:hypothetical protein